MAPKVYGSSTMGVKKSTVCTRAHSGVSLYTPASSAVSNPTSTFSFAHLGMRASTWSKTFGLSLDAQPAAEVWAVSLVLFETVTVSVWHSGGAQNLLGANHRAVFAVHIRQAHGVH